VGDHAWVGRGGRGVDDTLQQQRIRLVNLCVGGEIAHAPQTLRAAARGAEQQRPSSLDEGSLDKGSLDESSWDEKDESSLDKKDESSLDEKDESSLDKRDESSLDERQFRVQSVW
jgi:hypothetical protein